MSKVSPPKHRVGVVGILGNKNTRAKRSELASLKAKSAQFADQINESGVNPYASEEGANLWKMHSAINTIQSEIPKGPNIYSEGQIEKAQNTAMINNWMGNTQTNDKVEAKRKKQIHYSKEDLKQLSDEEFDRIYKELETDYNKFTEQIRRESENIEQDEKDLNNILKDTPDDESTVAKIRNFINDSNQLIIQFTELKTHIANSLRLFDTLHKRRQTLNRILKKQKIRPIDTRQLSLKSLSELEKDTGRKARPPSSNKNASGLKRHFGGKHKKTRKRRKSRSRK